MNAPKLIQSPQSFFSFHNQIYDCYFFSPDGGVDIEEVAEKTPDRIKKVPVDIHAGVTDDIANDVAGLLTNSILLS